MDTQEPSAENQFAAAATVVAVADVDSDRPALIARLACYGQLPDHGLEVQVTHFSEHLLALRSPVALQPGTEYRVN